MTPKNDRSQSWQNLISQVRGEYLQLDANERGWIEKTCSQIGRIQTRLDQLFQAGDGLAQCKDCRGDCCALGHNHLTLANLLLWFTQEVRLPELNFNSTCPLLQEKGCILPPDQRPYNCISFLCGRIEGQLQPEDIDTFYALEQELRAHYRAFAERYSGGSMTGLLLAAQRLKGQPFLQRIN